MTNIYLIRHGQSEGNLKRRFLGHTDLDLTELGHAQAEKTAEYLKDIEVDVIYASDLKRAYNTGLHTAEKKGKEIVKSPLLREIWAGDWENQTFDIIETVYGKDYSVWRTDTGHACCTNGESVAALYERIVGEITRIAEENEGKTVFIFTHATPIRVFRASVDGVGLDGMKELPWATNASVTHVEYENGKFTLVDYGKDDFLSGIVTALPKNV